MKMTIEQVNSAGEVAGQTLTLEVVGGRGLPGPPGNAVLTAEVQAALAGSDNPSAENPFVT
jgi:hypothetical protein